MTTADMARAVRIAAYRFAYGANVAAAERTLQQYMPALEGADLQRALYYGGLVASAGEQMSGGFELQAEATLQEVYSAFPGGVQALVRYQIGPDTDNDWRTTTVYPGANATPEQIRQLAESAVGQLVSGVQGGRYPVMPNWTTQQATGSIQYTYIGPTGLAPI